MGKLDSKVKMERDLFVLILNSIRDQYDKDIKFAERADAYFGCEEFPVYDNSVLRDALFGVLYDAYPDTSDVELIDNFCWELDFGRAKGSDIKDSGLLWDVIEGYVYIISIESGKAINKNPLYYSKVIQQQKDLQKEDFTKEEYFRKVKDLYPSYLFPSLAKDKSNTMKTPHKESLERLETTNESSVGNYLFATLLDAAEKEGCNVFELIGRSENSEELKQEVAESLRGFMDSREDSVKDVPTDQLEEAVRMTLKINKDLIKLQREFDLEGFELKRDSDGVHFIDFLILKK